MRASWIARVSLANGTGVPRGGAALATRCPKCGKVSWDGKGLKKVFANAQIHIPSKVMKVLKLRPGVYLQMEVTDITSKRSESYIGVVRKPARGVGYTGVPHMSYSVGVPSKVAFALATSQDALIRARAEVA